MANPISKTERLTNECILVPRDDPANAFADAHDSSFSGDEISIHVEGPTEHDKLNDSLSNSAFTVVTLDTDATATEDPCGTLRRSRIRFRSRVRITSGLHHHRERDHQRHRSATSSLSSSRSSSISAPLRSPLTEDTCAPEWGTLGTRVGLLAASHRRAAAAAAQARNTKYRKRRRDPAVYYSSDDNGRVDLVFGTWPWRLLNRKWWWWHLEPLVHCGCLDESDGED
ncbi:hypothetical protein C8R43DRAFT_1121780 [Mycena crocata]|nr:hypothetical protein C8R43DRAFT_1121780 [Mycena crocata]